MSKKIETFEIDGGARNLAVHAVEEITEGAEVKEFRRLGIITEPIIPLAGFEFISQDAEGANRQGHHTFAKALARFQ